MGGGNKGRWRMQILSSALLVASGAGLAGIAWLLVANYWTLRDGLRAIEWAFDEDQEWRDRQPLIDAVSYEHHLRHRFFLLNPWRLYAPRVQAAMRRGRA